MRKRIKDEYPTKAKKREIKKRPRMKVHGRDLLTKTSYAGKKLAK